MKDKMNDMQKTDNTVKQKSNLRIAWSWFGTHVIIVVLCVVVSFSLITLTQNRALQIGIGVITVLMYVMLMNGPAWKQGNDDLNKVKFNRRPKDLSRGFKIGLLTTVPMFVMALLLILAKAELFPNFYVVYKILNAHVLVFMNLIDHTFDGIATSYLTVVSWGQVIGVCALTLITPIACGISYILGYKDILIAEKLIYKNRKHPAKNSKSN